jgi:hypothetical protein
VVFAESPGLLDAGPYPVIEYGLFPLAPRRRGTTRHADLR